MGLPLFPCWDCGFECHRRHGCLSLVSVGCCQVEVSKTGRSLARRSPSVVCLSEITTTQQWGGLGPLGLSNHGKKCYINLIFFFAIYSEFPRQRKSEMYFSVIFRLDLAKGGGHVCLNEHPKNVSLFYLLTPGAESFLRN